MRLLLALPLTVALGALDLWAAIPAGLVLRLPRCLAASPLRREAWLGAVLVTTAGERLQRLLYSQRWFSKRRERVDGASLGSLRAYRRGLPIKIKRLVESPRSFGSSALRRCDRCVIMRV